MNQDEIFEAVRQINIRITKAKKMTDEANATLKESIPLLNELLEATRKQSTQTSLDDFATKMSGEKIEDKELTVVKESIAPRVLSELFTLDDLRKMILED